MQIQRKGNGFILKGQNASVSLGLKSGDEEILVPLEEGAKAKKGQAVFDWPGEYEQKGVMVRVLETGKEKNGLLVKVLQDDMAFLYIGVLGEGLTEAEEEIIGSVDILLAPHDEESAKLVQQMAEAFEPKLVLPYGFSKDEEAVAFAKRFGVVEPEIADVIKVKKGDLSGERVEVKVAK